MVDSDLTTAHLLEHHGVLVTWAVPPEQLRLMPRGQVAHGARDRTRDWRAGCKCGKHCRLKAEHVIPAASEQHERAKVRSVREHHKRVLVVTDQVCRESAP